MRTLSHLATLVTLGSLTVTSCSAPGTADTRAAAAAAEPGLAVARGLGVMNANQPLPHLLTAGQISREQLDSLAAAGYSKFVSLRLPGEQGAGWEEAYASTAGIAFERLPIEGEGDLTRANVEALDHILDAAQEAGTVLYCGSSNRVGALLALRAYWLDGASSDEALNLGRSAGMTRLEPAVTQLLDLGR